MIGYCHSKTACVALLFCSQIITTGTPLYSGVQVNLRSEEYAVFSKTIKSIFIDNVSESERFDLLVLQDRTSLQAKVANDLDNAFSRWKEDMRFLDQEALIDLKTKNEQSHQLERLFDIPMTYAIVGREDLKKSLGEGDASDQWTRFYKAYPNSSGLVRFSRVGFNREMSQALVYLEKSCGDGCAHGRIIILIKETDGWVVRKTYTMWVV